MALRCARWTVSQVREDGELVVPLRCKCWHCPDCHHINRKLLLRRLQETEVTHLITLTCSPRAFSHPSEAFRHLSLAVPNLVKRIRRQFPAVTFQYLLVWETTRAGWPHAHLLARTSYLPQRALSRHWRELTGAPVVDIRRVTDARGATSYVAKYLTKTLSAPPGLKRLRTSRHFWPTPGGLFGRSASVDPWKLYEARIEAVLLTDFPSLLFYHVPTATDSVLCLPRASPQRWPTPGLRAPAPRQQYGAAAPRPLQYPRPSRGGVVPKGLGAGWLRSSARDPHQIPR